MKKTRPERVFLYLFRPERLVSPSHPLNLSSTLTQSRSRHSHCALHCALQKLSRLTIKQAVTAMNGTITTWFQDKGFGFIKDENGDNRYFHVIKVANPELIKKSAAVTFEPTTNSKGLSAYAVKVLPESKYIFIAGERIKLTAIKSFVVFSEEVPADSRIDKENTVLSVGSLLNNIRPKTEAKPGEMRTVKKLAITTFQGTTLIFSEDEIDVDATAKMLNV